MQEHWSKCKGNNHHDLANSNYCSWILYDGCNMSSKIDFTYCYFKPHISSAFIIQLVCSFLNPDDKYLLSQFLLMWGRIDFMM